MADEAVTLTIEFDDPAFFAALQDPAGFMPHLGEAMQDIMGRFQEVASVYAPESEANRPGRFDANGRPMGYWERGAGAWVPITGRVRVGNIMLSHNVQYKFIGGSQQMNQRWEHWMEVEGQDVVGHLMNSATYSPYVQGYQQAAIHMMREWQTVDESWYSEEMQMFVEDRTFQAIEDYYHA